MVLWSSISTLRTNATIEESLQAFESRVMSSQTLLFPEEIEFSKDEYDILLEIFPYLVRIGFKIIETDDSKLIVEATSDMWGDEKIIRKLLMNSLVLQNIALIRKH